MADVGQITLLLESAAQGDSRAADELLPLVYEELRELAESRLRHLPPDQTLQATALVHEAYLKIASGAGRDFQSRSHFFFTAALAMRDILVDAARRKSSQKHGGDRQRVQLDRLTLPFEAPADEMLALSEALEAMEKSHPRKHKLVMLRFFGGLSSEDAAEVLGVDNRTALRDWRFARAWIAERLSTPSVLGDG